MDRIENKEAKQLSRLENRINTIKMEWINEREYERRTYGNCPDQSSVLSLEADLRHHAPMLGNGRGPREVGPRRTYQGIV